MKKNLSFLILFTLGVNFFAAAQNCDQWIVKAYQLLLNRTPSSQECNIKNYNNGSWSSYAELVGYVARYQGKGDPWLFQAYYELYNKVPTGDELNLRNYNNGSWNNYAELKKYIQNFQSSKIAIKKERIQSAYMLAFGRKATSGEENYWTSQPDKTLSAYLDNHRSFAYNQDEATRKAIITKSYLDILGRNPTTQEIQYWLPQRKLYYELTQNHIQYLVTNPSEYEKVIQRSYTAVLKRNADAGEITYWKSIGTLSYAVLLSCHYEWKKRNGAAAKKTSGQNNVSEDGNYLQTVPVSSSIANEIKAAAGGNVVAPGGGNVIAPGGGNVVSPGGGNVIAAGGGNVIAPGGAN